MCKRKRARENIQIRQYSINTPNSGAQLPRTTSGAFTSGAHALFRTTSGAFTSGARALFTLYLGPLSAAHSIGRWRLHINMKV